MLQQAASCRNKDQAELKQETKLCLDKGFLCRDNAEEVSKEDCRDILYSVATLIKANGSRTLLRRFLLYHNIKELKITYELCRDIR